jgi:hypothetical protein
MVLSHLNGTKAGKDKVGLTEREVQEPLLLESYLVTVPPEYQQY